MSVARLAWNLQGVRGMKRMVMGVAIAALLLVAGCAGSEMLQEIRIEVGGVQVGQMGTKSAEDVLSATAAGGDVLLVLKGVDVTTRRYEVVSGQSVSVPVGRYKVTGEWKNGQKLGEAMYNAVYAQPCYSVDAEINVVEGQSEYRVEGVYTCFALVIDYAECEKYRHQSVSKADWSDFAWMQRVGDWGVAYIGFGAQWGTNGKYMVSAVPVDLERYEERQYGLVNLAGQAGVLVEAGKWYKLSAREVTFQSGTIGVDLPEWVQGL